MKTTIKKISKNKLVSWAIRLNKKYGKRGTSIRSEFE